VSSSQQPSGCGVIASIVVVLLVLGGLYWLNDAATTKDNITCVRQSSVAGVIRYELCIAGQAQPRYVPYSVWRTAKVGGYYDETSHTAYKSAGDDPHVSHGIGGEVGGEGHGGEGGGHGGGGK
jgi:uncharacterized membrane protein YgcG